MRGETRRRIAALSVWLAITVAVASIANSKPPESGLQLNRRGSTIAGTAGAGSDSQLTAPTVPERTEVLYEGVSSERNGETVAFEERGSWSLDLWRRVARPWDYIKDGLVYDEEAWAVGDDVERGERGYRVELSVAKPVEAVYRGVPAGEAFYDPALEAALRKAQRAEPVRILIKLDAPNAPDLPLVPRPGTLSVADHLDAVALRREALRELEGQGRRSKERLAVAAVVESFGGRLVRAYPRTHWLAVEVPAEAVDALRQLDDVARLHLDDVAEPQGLSLAELRGPDYTDATRFRAAGYHGEYGSNANLIVGVAEVDGIEDEVCFLDDVGNVDTCDTDERLKKKFTCTAGGGCSSTNNYSFSQEASHGTVVTSIIAADYTQNQAGGVNVGGGLPAGWEEDATGFAKEVDVHYYRFTGSSSNQATAVECAQGIGSGCSEVDVFNSSNGYSSGSCDPTSSTTLEDEIEDLWDDGVLPVISAGNNGGGVNNTSCTVMSPSDTPKAFAVGGLEASTTDDYHTWGRMNYTSDGVAKSSARGGADIEVGGVIRQGTMSVVDLAAPGQGVDFVTNDDGANGTVYPVYGARGTSVAAPMVAGAAISVKDWMLQSGNTWIDNPGRLHAMMLGMGDRGTLSGAATWPGCVDGDRIRCGADELLGLGRMKLRLFQNGQGMGPWGHWVRTKTITPTTPDPWRRIPFSNGIPSGAEMVKCVMQQREDMSSKDDISLIGLRLRIRSKVGGQCVTGQGSVHWTYYDALYDDKHMVAILDSDVNIENRCLEVELDKVILSSANSVTTHTYCYYAGLLDDES